MTKSANRLKDIIAELADGYGPPVPPGRLTALEMILQENVAYLVSDAKRQAAFQALAGRIGTTASEILAAPRAALLGVAQLGGMLPDSRVEKLINIARLTMEEFGGNLQVALKQTETRAKKSLMKFPGIGEPGAEKILLYTRTFPILALDSNALRVLIRIGYGKETGSYSKTYRSVREAIKDEVTGDYDWLIRANQLLTRHGKTICRRTGPLCEVCTLSSTCNFFAIRQPG
jgi:endonuclease-3